MNYSRSVFGIIFVLIMLAGFTSLSFSEYVSPRAQLQSGVLPEDIQCRDDRVLVLRTNGNIACVSERTAERIGWKIIETESIIDISQNEFDKTLIPDDTQSNSDISLVKQVVELKVSSDVEFVDDGRKYPFAIQKAPAPRNVYDKIIQHQATGLSADPDGFIRIESVPHEKYSVNPGVGYYPEDWIPTFIPDGYKLLYSETAVHPLRGTYALGLTFVPTTYELNENVTDSDLKSNKGFMVIIKKHTTPLDEIEDMIEYLGERRESQPNNYGGFLEMTRDGKTVFAYEGGNHFNRYQAILNFHPDEFTSHSVISYYHTLDELIPIFQSVGN